jgi:hypothetical protein
MPRQSFRAKSVGRNLSIGAHMGRGYPIWHKLDNQSECQIRMSKKFDKMSKMFYTAIMSKIFDMVRSSMAYEEKLTWGYLIVSALSFFGYALWLLPNFLSQPVAQIAYVQPILIAIGIAIVASIVLTTFLSIGDKTRDDRDKEIQREGDFRAQFILEIGAMVAFGLTLAKLEHFWIAHTLYIAFVLDAVLGAALKIVLYRQGYLPE